MLLQNLALSYFFIRYLTFCPERQLFEMSVKKIFELMGEIPTQKLVK